MPKKIVTVNDICSGDDEQYEIKVKLCEKCKDRFKCRFYVGWFLIGGFFRRIKYAFQLAMERREDRKRAFGLRKERAFGLRKVKRRATDDE